MTTIGYATAKLGHAIGDLIDPQPKLIYLDNGHSRSTYIPSRYQHLVDSLGGQQVEAKSGGQARLPVWADAVDALTEIDRTVAQWVRGNASTRQRLVFLDLQTFRPQDTKTVLEWAETVKAWCQRIDLLLDPPGRKEVLAPCPSCGTRYVWRQQAGEQVRESALQLTPAAGCQCLHCKTVWTPDRFMFLCRLIGGAVPDGVLE